MAVLGQGFDAAARAWDFGWSIGLLVTLLAFLASVIMLWLHKVTIPQQTRADEREAKLTDRQLRFFDSLENSAAEQTEAIKHISAGIVLLESTIGKVATHQDELSRWQAKFGAEQNYETARLKRAVRTLLEAARLELGDGRPRITASIDRALSQLEHQE